MRKLRLQFLGCVAGLICSGMVSAIGFGAINVTSSLGQPLAAEIELVAVERAEQASLTANLASADAFKGAGLEYPRGLPKLKFQLATRPNGDFYIKATSEQPLNEPFVNLLIELTWSSGRLLREYTFLLDPPGFVAEKPPVAPVQPIEPVTPVAAESNTPPAAVAVAPLAPPAEPALAPVAEKPVVAPAAKPKAVTASAEGRIKVKRGDTLSAIAKQQKAPEVSLERMLVALYRANEDAFDGKNMNRLRVGKILRVPEQAELVELAQKEAAHEVHIQVVDWNAYRQKLAAAPSKVQEQHPRQEVAGKITPLLAEKAPAVKPAAKEVLKLSKGELPGEHNTAPAKAKTAQELANAREEEAVAKAKALQETQQRTEALEKNILDMQRLVALKNQAAQSAAASAAPAASSVAIASAVPAASAVAAKPVVKAPVPKAAPKELSIKDELLANPTYLGAGAAALIGILGLAWIRVRRAQNSAEQPPENHEQALSALTRIAEPVPPSPETGDFTNIAASTTVLETGIDEIDPIGEAELFLSFGRDAQAQEVLQEALAKDPANMPVKLKLLSIFANRQDVQSFQTLALEVQASGDAAAWAKAAALGREIDPGNILYGGDGTAEVAAAEPLAETAAPVIDFDLDFGNVAAEPMMQAIDLNTDLAPVVGEQTMIVSADELQSAQAEPMDFDITATHPGVKPAAPVVEPDLSAMDFDLSVAQVAAPEAAPLPELVSEPLPEMPAAELVAMPLELSTMDFDITASHVEANTNAPELAEAGAGVATELAIEGMNFDFTAEPAAPIAELAAPVADEEVKPEPELSLDDLIFDVTGKRPDAEPAPVAAEVAAEPFNIDFALDQPAPVLNAGLSDINLQLDETAPPAPASKVVKNEQWQEVATKLDLAKAYHDMGDLDGTREILLEVLAEGDEEQRRAAEELMQQLV